MRLYIIRHADPDYENNTITPQGHLEARALAQRMATVGLTHLYQSPLGRAQHTAQYTAELTGLTPVTEDWTCEIGHCFYEHPQLGKINVWDIPGEIVRQSSPFPTHEDWRRIDPTYAPAIRQRFEALRLTSDALLARHGYQRDAGRYRIVRPNRDRIAVFCHGGLAVFWLAHLLEIPLPLAWSGFWHAPTAVTTILLEERSNRWAVPRALAVADTSHLYANNLPIQPRGILGNYD